MMRGLIGVGALAASLVLAPAAGATVLPGATYTYSGDTGVISVTLTVSPDGGTVDVALIAASSSPSCGGVGFTYRGIPVVDGAFTETRSEAGRSSVIDGEFVRPGVATGTIEWTNGTCGSDAYDWSAEVATPWADLALRRGGERKSKARGGDVYNDSASGQTRAWRLKRGKERAFIVTLQNDGTERGRFVLRGCRRSGGVKVSYMAGRRPVTKKVTGRRGYTVKALKAGAERAIRVVFKATKKARKGKRKSCGITAETSVPGTLGTQRDVVKAVVTVR